MKEIKFRFFLLIIFFNLLFITLVLCEPEKTCVEGPDQTCEYTEKPKNDIPKEEKPKNEKSKDETPPPKNEKPKDEKHKDENPRNRKPKIDINDEKFDDIKYSDLFLSLPIITKDNINTSNYNSTQYFDLSINKKILKFIRENGVVPYPHYRFKEKQQGNFLHFMHLAYEKKLPVYFTIDQIVYPYIEMTKQLNYDITEFVFHPVYITFLNNIINYGIKANYNKGIVLYFSLGAKFLSFEENNEKNEKFGKKSGNLDDAELIKNDKLCEAIVDEIFTREENDTDYTFNFTLLGQKRSLNKLSFFGTKKITKKGNIISQRITNSLRFFQEFIFDGSVELYNIYLIGKLISESGQEKLYKKIKQFVQYLFNEEEENMNPLEIYNYINNNYKDKINKEKEINELFETIKDKVKKPKRYDFLKYVDFFDKEQEKYFYEKKNKDFNLFSYSMNIEDWVNNKMVNYEKGRLFPSILEFADIVFDGKIGRKAITKRFTTKKVEGKLFSFRDGINLTEKLDQTKNWIEKSMKEEKSKWINSYDNSFYYLLNTIGHTANDTDKNSLIKSFNTIISSYVHFKNDILLIQQYTNISYAKEGSIPDIHFENNTEFYNKIKEITSKYRDEIINLVNCLSDSDKKEKISEIVNYKINKLFKAYDNILKILNNKDKDKNNNKEIIDDMFYYDRKSDQYQGWYVNLYKDNHNVPIYNLDIYAYNFFIANPIKELKFSGAIVYEVMFYPEIGLVTVDDEESKGKKLYLFAGYNGNEFPRVYSKKIDFKGLQENIIARKY